MRLVERFAIGAWVGAAVLFTSSIGFAFDRVVVLSDPGTTLSVRLQAELGTLGVDSVPLPVPEDISPESLESIAHDREALATILLVGKEHVVEIWIADRTTGKTVLRRIPVQAGSATDDTAVTKTVELLRASLLELRMQDPEKPVPAVVNKLIGPAPVPPPLEPRHRRWVTMRLGPAIAFGSSSLPPSAQIDTAVVFAPVDLVAIGVALSIPTMPASFKVEEGEVTRSQFWATGVFEVHPWKQAVVDPRFGVAIGFEVADGEGDGTGPYLSQSSVTGAALGLLEVGLAIPLAEMVALDAQLDWGMTLPRTDYTVTERIVGSTGWPTCSGALGIAVSL